MLRSLIAATCFVLTGACSALAQGAGDVQNLPPAIQAEISKAVQMCTDGKASLEKGFITRAAVSGNGAVGYVLDYQHFGCGRHSFFCGPAGCEMQVFVSSSRSGFQSVFDGNARTLKFTKIDGRPAMIIDLHAAGCESASKAPCQETLFWDGSGFRQLSEGRLGLPCCVYGGAELPDPHELLWARQ